MFASVACVSATPTTLAVPVTVLWTQLRAWPRTDRSATVGASASVAPVSALTPSSKGRPVRCVRPASVSVRNISKSFPGAGNSWYLLSVDLCSIRLEPE